MHLSRTLTALTVPSLLGAAAYPDLIHRASSIGAILQSHAHEFSPNTTIYLPNSPGFYNITERWTLYDAPSYSAAISPATEIDIVKTLKLVNRYNISFLATGGRHSYTTTIGALRNGLEIDLSKFETLRIDTKAQTLTVGPGIEVGQIFDPLFNAGFEIQTGSAPCPSLIGITLGGGIGRYQGVYGLVSDALISARIITADGRLLNVSATSNPDLFWAIRGAGANFGIVTEATYGIHPLVNKGNNFLIEYVVPAERSTEFFGTLEKMQPIPAKLSSIVLNTYNASTNATQLQIEFTYMGTESEAQKYLQPVYDLNLTVTARLPEVKWNVLISSAFGGNTIAGICARNITRDLYSLNLKTYSASSYAAAFTRMQTYFAKTPGGRNSLLIYELFPNQAMAAIPSSASAFKWRDSTGYVSLNFLYDGTDKATQDASAAAGKDVRKILAAGSGYGQLTTFINYAHGDEGLDRIYGSDKLPRLASLKKRYDPKHFFNFNNGIPSSYP